MKHYRGRRLDNNVLVYGWLFERGGGSYIIPFTGNYHTPASFVLTFVPVEPKTVGQQVGLKDKNGKGDETYAGDIVSSFNGIKHLIYWDSEYGQWWGHIINETKGKYSRPLCEILDNSYMHIIGNIHENPELMEKQE